MEGPRMEIMNSTTRKQVEIRSAVDNALAAERAKSARRFNILLGGMVALAVVILAVVLQMLHLLPTWLGGSR